MRIFCFVLGVLGILFSGILSGLAWLQFYTFGDDDIANAFKFSEVLAILSVAWMIAGVAFGLSTSAKQAQQPPHPPQQQPYPDPRLHQG